MLLLYLYIFYICLYNNLLLQYSKLSDLSILKESMLKLSKLLSLFPFKWLIEIVFTERSPADENIYPLPVSKQKS